MGVLLQAAGAGIALRAVWMWERTRVVLTGELFVVQDDSPRAAAVRLRDWEPRDRAEPHGAGMVTGRVVAGDLEIDYVRAAPGLRPVERLSG